MQSTQEQWKPVLGFEGLYEVSNIGRVRTVPRVVVRSNGRPLHIRARERRVSPNHKGYLKVTLTADGKHVTRTIHRLVLEAFVGPAPRPGLECRHLNGDQKDNRIENLAWGTRLENANDVRLHGTNPNTRKTRCKRGHLLVGPNLLPDSAGKRICRACMYEHKVAHEQNRGFDLEQSDKRYLKILERSMMDIICATIDTPARGRKEIPC